MDDEKIIDLYFARDQAAINETDKKYGAYLAKLAYNILQCREDTEEILEDTYLRAWNNIPPTRPEMLRHFLSRIAQSLL